MSWYLWFLFLQDENAQKLFFFSLYAKRNGECLFKYWINLLIYWSFSLLSLRWPDDGLWLVILIWQRNRSIKPSQWPIHINYGIHYTLILLSRWMYRGPHIRVMSQTSAFKNLVTLILHVGRVPMKCQNWTWKNTILETFLVY